MPPPAFAYVLRVAQFDPTSAPSAVHVTASPLILAMLDALANLPHSPTVPPTIIVLVLAIAVGTRLTKLPILSILVVVLNSDMVGTVVNSSIRVRNNVSFS